MKIGLRAGIYNEYFRPLVELGAGVYGFSSNTPPYYFEDLPALLHAIAIRASGTGLPVQLINNATLVTPVEETQVVVTGERVIA